MSSKKQGILYIDGENLKHYIKKILEKHSKIKSFVEIDLNLLLASALETIDIRDRRFYSAKVRLHPSFEKKSNELIQKQRKLKTLLEKQGFYFVIGGNVRGQKVSVNGKEKIVFHEKGVDVKLAVDMVSDACDKKVETIILCSSDSDLQPAVSEVKKRGAEIIYLGFESQPNKGLIYTCNRSILIRDAEILKAFK